VTATAQEAVRPPRVADPIRLVITDPVERREATKGLLLGIAFGATFPVVGVLVAAGWRWDPAYAHGTQSVLYIVDTAPFVIGMIGYWIGRVYGRLLSTRLRIEETVKQRTAELEEALSELSQAQGQLLQAQKLEAIGSLAAGVAHEINTPIQYIGDNARFLQEAFEDVRTFHLAADHLAKSAKANGACADVVAAFERARDEADLEFLEEEIPSATKQALEGVDRVATIVRALKDFSHPGSDTKSPIDVNKSIQDTLSVSRNEWKYFADVNTDLDPHLPTAEALAGPLNQALLIIVVNAAQALEEKLGDSGEKGAIHITSKRNGDHVVVSIADDAGGIPAEVQGRIFEPFFTTKEVGKGSGQGLAIARSVLVEQHGGDLTFDVEDGVGTTFHLHIPIEAVEA
jgi:signal transduction histidine kinase